ncbi:hypothetical protein [Xylella fastidiosa]|uniref:Uncharacterized protein n=1 Tax=Xylella fastidiosa subsp. multiplex TaxID=644357 RepID=A0A9Q4MKF3_XYLFS|nr:hypothetical protein [Xylella fastidiosa]KAJ4853217.1 hypothetical protein XYFPCFBP8418_002885 [Xylella fastidiosa subsp. multiplex]KFA41444.1 hypothetical protein DF22_002023 [Xylella fastidiosa]MBE0268281.1 hypothetical protein [Xylella fastidiosa subsp. multiplex]MBE0274786.1 hypothetical protein [Xylella fastidiosa subsp. multiplex]MBE0277025.1 hypothetical protein [Xylella fastidiosa subsp. multiplex]
MKKFEMDVSGDVSHVVANEWIHALSGVVGAMPGVGFVREEQGNLLSHAICVLSCRFRCMSMMIMWVGSVLSHGQCFGNILRQAALLKFSTSGDESAAMPLKH